jgi:hypothetical protein
MMCDAGDVCTILANIQTSFDQISRGVGRISGIGALPIMLAGVPCHGRDRDGRRLALPRVKPEQAADVAAVTPQLDGQGMRTDPLPASRVARRRRVRLVHLLGTEPVRRTPAEARALTAE